MSNYEYHHLAPPFDWYPGAPGRPCNFYAPAAMGGEVVVSIVTSTYNPQPLFEQTIAAVFGQSLQAWEWVIVDDASTDIESQRRLKQFAARDARVKLLRQPINRGLAAGRNSALKQAYGRYVFFLDDDDLIEPTTLEKLVWFLETHPHLTMAKGSTVAFGGQEYHATTNFDARNLFLQRNPITVMSLVRREALQAVGGFDDALVHGMEDWDLWLKLAAHGYWGGGIPEFLDWYRRRPDHGDRWQSWTPQGSEEMRAELKRRYPQVFRHGIPQPQAPFRAPYTSLTTELPFTNRLAKDRPRLLLVIPWMAMGGADRFNLEFLQDWTRRGYECTVVTTIDRNYVWYREYARLTPDIFILPYFLPIQDQPRFLDYLIGSRQYDVVLVSNSEWGYRLLPYLRARHPDVAYVDYNHMEEEYWQSGGHPRRAVAYQDVLDLNLTASHHLKQWMVDRGGDAEQIDVVYISVDTERFKPDPALRASVRARLGIDAEMPVIIYAGRICAQKQPRVFASVMRDLVRTKQRFVCLVLGEGEDLPWLRRYVHRHRLGDQVWLLGPVSNEAMRDYLSAGDIFFLPSLMEGIALTIYEAMAMKLAIVGADVGGQSELVTPECGVLVQRGEFEEEVARYTGVLRALLSDPYTLKQMGEAARARVEAHFRLSKMGEKMTYELLERAPALHAMRPKPIPGIHLALEHLQLTMESQRLSQSLSRMEKYARIEKLRQQISSRIYDLIQQTQTHPIVQRLKPIKDVLWVAGHSIKITLYKGKDMLWIAGHRLKVVLRKKKDSLWIVGHRIKVRLGGTRD